IIAKAPPHTTCGPGAVKKLLVRVTLPSSCDSASVKVKGKKFRQQTFQATQSVCGDGQIDSAGGEECDGSGRPATATCDGTCKCQPIAPNTTSTTVVTGTTMTTTSVSGNTTTSSTMGSVTVTTTSSTLVTTTTFIGACFDIDRNLTNQACTTNVDCPS